MALKRLQEELTSIRRSPVYGITQIGPVNDNMFEWQATLEGPEGTPYHGGFFMLRIIFPNDYPFKPPSIHFLTKIYHPNIGDGDASSRGFFARLLGGTTHVCTDALDNKWTPASNIAEVLLSIVSMLDRPNTKSPLNSNATRDYEDNRQEFERKAREWAKQYAQK